MISKEFRQQAMAIQNEQFESSSGLMIYGIERVVFEQRKLKKTHRTGQAIVPEDGPKQNRPWERQLERAIKKQAYFEETRSDRPHQYPWGHRD